MILGLDHPFAGSDKFPISELLNCPFILMEKSAKAEIAEIFEKHHISPHVNFTTWDDFAIMSMVENGLGISILPELVLKRTPFRIITKELEIPAFRSIGIAMKEKKTLSLSTKRFLEYIQYRKKDESSFISL